MKICSVCKKELEESMFHKDSSRKDGLSYKCKNCRKKTHRILLSENRKKFDRSIYNSMKRALIKNKKNLFWEKIVGYTVDDLRKHLESKFTKKMNWSNFISYWWIHKIIPKSFYVYSKKTDELRKCWSLKNMIPLEANICRRKQDSFHWNLVKKYNLFDILPVGILHIDKNDLLLDNKEKESFCDREKRS
jgi:hypothetical protein